MGTISTLRRPARSSSMSSVRFQPQASASAFEPPAVASASAAPSTAVADLEQDFITEARFYKKLPEGKVRCLLCPRECTLREGVRGYCGVRENRHGSLFTLVYGRVCAAHIDPVEKKPFFHYMPGSLAFSVATAGCNVNCKFCQNWELSQASPEDAPGESMPPARVVELARQYNCPTIAFTYTEPIVCSEFVMDTADRAHEQGLRTIEVSNGYIHKDALESVYGRMDAVKIDLKAFSDSYYRKVVVGELKPVLETLVALVKLGKWTEIVYLLVPARNDGDEELTALARWIKAHLGVNVPLHFSQFHPDYKMLDLPTTSVTSLERARRIAQAEGLQYVYIGNVPEHPAESTYCPHCSRLLVHRSGYNIRQMLICDGACPYCRLAIPGVWNT